MASYVVGLTSEIPLGTSKIVTIRGREIGIFNVDNEFFGLINRCPHEGAALCRGQIVGQAESDEPGEYRLTRKGEMLRCPWHAWLFDIRTGQSWCDPQTISARSYSVRIAAGEQIVKGKMVAETIPVRVEENYIVIDV